MESDPKCEECGCESFELVIDGGFMGFEEPVEFFVCRLCGERVSDDASN